MGHSSSIDDSKRSSDTRRHHRADVLPARDGLPGEPLLAKTRGQFVRGKRRQLADRSEPPMLQRRDHSVLLMTTGFITGTGPVRAQPTRAQASLTLRRGGLPRGRAPVRGHPRGDETALKIVMDCVKNAERQRRQCSAFLAALDDRHSRARLREQHRSRPRRGDRDLHAKSPGGGRSTQLFTDLPRLAEQSLEPADVDHDEIVAKHLIPGEKSCARRFNEEDAEGDPEGGG